MRALSAADVVSAWERARGRPPIAQALEYLAAATPERQVAEWAGLPFGQFCEALFRFRSIMFGPAMPGVVECPSCGEPLEFSFNCAEIARPHPGVGPVRVDAAGRAVELRLPTAADLLSCHSSAELVTRCATEPVEPTSELIETVSAVVANADPLIETQLNLVCPACDCRWQAVLDIVSYFTREMTHHVRRLLGDVHALASAYGWSEHDILALSPVRRRAYVGIVEA